jgi:hypothetical protein
MQPRCGRIEQGSQPIWSELLGPTSARLTSEKIARSLRLAARQRALAARAFDIRAAGLTIRCPWDTVGDWISLQESRPARTAGAFDRNHIVQYGLGPTER